MQKYARIYIVAPDTWWTFQNLSLKGFWNLENATLEVPTEQQKLRLRQYTT